ncbi:MAG TPA: APC family permease [Candidatus Dormibacteraeota bacterium]|jgi:amino acid transporter|nr:APC family permease [Candidatus Dormibacteraeota bacterium]
MALDAKPPGAAAEEDFLKEAGEAWAKQSSPQMEPLWRVDPDVETYEDTEDTGGEPGVVRVARSASARLQREGPGLLKATISSQRRGDARISSARSLLLGAPLASARMLQERLPKWKALAVLSSDALSSVAYATEQQMAVLLLAGVAALSLSIPLGVAICVLLLVVGLSYRQTIKAYPSGGGSYIVAKDNLGAVPGLVAAAALMTDYVLTVAVSISAGIQAVTSAFPTLVPFTVLLGLIVIAFMVLGNLRGIREAGNIFALPTYFFIGAMVLLLVVGTYHYFFIGTANLPPGTQSTNYPPVVGIQTLGWLLVLRAFASGCTALTGVEAISNGIPIFKPPEWKNARTTLMFMIGILGVSYAGITVLAHMFAIQPDFSCGTGLPLALGQADCASHVPAAQTVLSKLSHIAFGNGLLYFYIQGATAIILVLAANTSFADFPRLLSLMARDKYAPSQFVSLGDRLVFSNGILALGILAGLLYWYFRGSTDALIPLYTVGVFMAFTLSQAGMVVHWRKLMRADGPRASHVGSMLMNGTGAVLTAVVLVIAGASKFVEGAWIVLLLIPILVLLSLAVHRHYAGAKERVQAETPLTPGEVRPVAIVPITDLTDVQLQTLALARRLADQVIAVFISDDPQQISEIREKWDRWGNHVPLQVIESPYRSIVRPFLDFLDAVDAQGEGRTVMVVLPELVFSRWWHQFLHNQTALRLKAALLFRPGTVVVNVPYHLRELEHRESNARR